MSISVKVAEVWRDYDPDWYIAHVQKKRHIFGLLADSIQCAEAKSCIEVGGGVGLNAPLFERYANIEAAPLAVAYGRQRYPAATFIDRDFFTVKPSECFRPDMFCAIDVVEHTAGFEPFMAHALDFRPDVMFVTFFNRLREREAHTIREVDSGAGQYYSNAYALPLVEKWLRANRFLYMLWRLPQDPDLNKCNDVLVATRDPDIARHFPRLKGWRAREPRLRILSVWKGE